MKFVMMSGLPRSGSTLLQNIMAQNKSLHITPTSATAEQVDRIRKTWPTDAQSLTIPEHEDQSQMLGFIRGAIFGKYSYTNKKTILDKNRSWPIMYGLMENILPETKIVICVRPLVEICASMEKIYQRNVAYYGRLLSNEEIPHTTPYERVQYWTGKGLIGGAFTVLQNFVNQGLQNKAYWIHYDELTTTPHKVIGGLYRYIGEEWDGIIHPVQNKVYEDDRHHGYRFLHTITEGEIKPSASNSREILGEECYTEIKKLEPTWPRMVL